MNLEGKTAIVTGGAVRLGRGITLGLAGEGVNIALHYGRSAEEARRTQAEIAALGAEAALIQADFNQPVDAAQAVINATVEAFGGAQILINSAAIFEDDSLATVTGDQWDRHFNINLKTPFFLAQAFAAQLAADQSGHIINIADSRGTRPGGDHLVYTLTKSGLVALTKSLALQLAPRVQVNAVAPGAILPPPGEDEKYLARIAERIPLRRTGSPEEIAGTVVNLLRSDFITGEILHVTGGEHL